MSPTKRSSTPSSPCTPLCPGSPRLRRHDAAAAAVAGPLPARPRALDLGCGPGRAALLLAAGADARVTAVDLHQPFLDELDAAAARRSLGGRIGTVNRSMAGLPYPDGSYGLVWAEGSAYVIGFDAPPGASSRRHSRSAV